MDTKQQINKESQGAKPMAILAIALALLAVFLFFSGLSEVPNKPLLDNIPTSAIVYSLLATTCGVLAKAFWTKASKE